MMASNRNAIRRPDQCRFFLQGYCRFGNRCWRSHGQGDLNGNIVEENKSISAPVVADDGNVGEDNGVNCAICLETCFTAGSHRLASLKCGHLFGHACIDRWLRSQGHSAKCPHCNSPATLRDIIVIYATLQKSVDAETLEDLEKERAMKRKLEEEQAEIRQKYEREASQVSKLQQELGRLQQLQEEKDKQGKEQQQLAELCQEKDNQVALLKEEISNMLLKVEMDKAWKSKQNIEKVAQPKQELSGKIPIEQSRSNAYVNSKSHNDNCKESHISNESEDLFFTCSTTGENSSEIPSSSQLSVNRDQEQNSSIFEMSQFIEPTQPCLGDYSEMKLSLQASVYVSKNGECRVIAYSDKLGVLAVSVPNPDVEKPGFTIKNINVKTMKIYLSVPKTGFSTKGINIKNIKTYLPVPFHEKQIRDITFSPINNEILLSVGLDSKIKLTDMENSSTIQTFSAESPLWSCCWSTHNAAQIFAGTASGCVIEFNITSGPMRTFMLKGSGPVVSLCYVPENPSHTFSSGGLLVGRLQSCNFIVLPKPKDSVSDYKDYTLPFKGPFSCLSFEPITRYMLVSCRPTPKCPVARHFACELMDCTLDSGRIDVMVRTVQEFTGGSRQKIMTRSFIASSPLGSETALVCANDETELSTSIWDMASGTRIQSLKVRDNVVDILTFSNTGNSFIVLLTEKIVKIYKWVDL
ncbi:unnamed protein product [Meganyctiphanes norvegica]|uniref:RING-type E3 ubiquitin transferase n=1 Tax=Meganyctiphanes norvegica TaxID=48144 RepID=A0AAV2QG53_MEGNR